MCLEFIVNKIMLCFDRQLNNEQPLFVVFVYLNQSRYSCIAMYWIFLACIVAHCHQV